MIRLLGDLFLRLLNTDFRWRLRSGGLRVLGADRYGGQNTERANSYSIVHALYHWCLPHFAH
jgi:hypothetical protein